MRLDAQIESNGIEMTGQGNRLRSRSNEPAGGEGFTYEGTTASRCHQKLGQRSKNGLHWIRGAYGLSRVY